MKPRVITKCVANAYAGPNERIVEFDGGLISFGAGANGEITVSLYRLDTNVRVVVGGKVVLDPVPA